MKKKHKVIICTMSALGAFVVGLLCVVVPGWSTPVSVVTRSELDDWNPMSPHGRPHRNLVDLAKEADCGKANAQYELGEHYWASHYDGMKDFAFPWFEKAARQGHVEAEYKLGRFCYAEGIGTSKDDEKAFYWIRKAAKRNHVGAQFELGFRYYSGTGTEKDLRKSAYWFEKAAQRGHPHAQSFLGRMYLDGNGVEQNDETAFHWFEKAANWGFANVQFQLGNMYHEGRGVEQDEVKAFHWIEKAADKGMADAQLNAAVRYASGEGVEQDFTKMFQWLEQAANQGNGVAQYELGIYYKAGIGLVRPDVEKARYWYQKAAAQGIAEAQKELDELYLALVLSGGGAKGAYEVGVWQELQENGLAPRVAAISGTSVGAINAALFATRPAAAETLWLENMEDVFTLNTNRVGKTVQKTMDTVAESMRIAEETGKEWRGWVHFILSSALRVAEDAIVATETDAEREGYIDSSRLAAALDANLPAEWDANTPAVYATAVKKGAGKAAEIWKLNGMTHGERILALRASAAIPFGFDTVRIDGKTYVDGGWEWKGGDNLPLWPILENHPEIKTVVVVHLDDAEHLSVARRDRVRAAANAAGVRLVEIIPSEDIGGLGFGWQGVFDASPETAKHLIKLGREDAQKALHEAGLAD